MDLFENLAFLMLAFNSNPNNRAIELIHIHSKMTIKTPMEPYILLYCEN